MVRAGGYLPAVLMALAVGAQHAHAESDSAYGEGHIAASAHVSFRIVVLPMMRFRMDLNDAGIVELQLDGNASRLTLRHAIGAGDLTIDSNRHGFTPPGAAAGAQRVYGFNKSTFYEAGIEQLRQTDHTEYRYTAASP